MTSSTAGHGAWSAWSPENEAGKWQIDHAGGPMCKRVKIATVHGKGVKAAERARLIAAAPETAKQRDELLAALEAVMPLYQAALDVCDGEGIGPNRDLTDQSLKVARAAIAAATGGA